MTPTVAATDSAMVASVSFMENFLQKEAKEAKEEGAGTRKWVARPDRSRKVQRPTLKPDRRLNELNGLIGRGERADQADKVGCEEVASKG